MRSPVGVMPGMEGGGFAAGAVFGFDVGVVVGVGGGFGAGAGVVLFGSGFTGGLEAGAVGGCALEEGGGTEVDGETGVCAAAILNAASDSATEQSGRSTRFM